MKMPIIDELNKFKKENYVKFFMPSHLQLNDSQYYTSTQRTILKKMKEFEKDIFSLDVTEVCNFDNLSNPVGIIKKSQDILANSFNVKKAHYLVNGSTVGVLAMILAVTNDKDKVIIQKNSHKSVYNACAINNLDIVFMNCDKNDEFDVYQKIDIKSLENIIVENPKAKAVVITSPDYYGQTQDLEKIYELTQKYNMYLLVDLAHGAHYNYSNLFYDSLTKHFDFGVCSFHKTLPSLNQTAVLLLNCDKCISKKVLEKINMLQTSSPSYILMSNIELINNLMKQYGDKLYDELYENIKIFKNKISKLNDNFNYKKINILQNYDFSRLVIHIQDVNTAIFYDFLKDNKILAEMSNSKSIIFICNIFHTKYDFDRLYMVIEDFVKKEVQLKSKLEIDIILEQKKQLIKDLKNNLGNISTQNIYLYPPGTPVVSKGEKITNNHILQIEDVVDNTSIQIIH